MKQQIYAIQDGQKLEQYFHTLTTFTRYLLTFRFLRGFSTQLLTTVLR